ncbi:MAG: type II CRISPR RNA-guided endonuclease Cas9 [Ruminiclostridium sp.]|nr:type II CRISPR RNA-guided endonuclease Cas9 [Ruminiclostridium sp.]
MQEEKIYVGLDIGTDSVGYAVTDQSYKLKKFHGEAMWGVTLFDEANLNNERRMHRTARRRLDRRQQRVSLVSELFAKEISKVDERFFIRLKESGLYRSESEAPFTLFNDKDFTDRDYHKRYPTIHHLIVELMSSDEPHDVRLVYLACIWLVAHRGHFLSEISMDNLSALTDFSIVYKELTDYFADNGFSPLWQDIDEAEIQTILRKKTSVTAKGKELSLAMFKGQKVPKEPAESFPFNTEIILKALCGSKINAKDMFCNDEYADIPSFTLASNEELEGITGLLGDDGELIKRLKGIFDWTLLVDSLQGKNTISQAKVRVYEKHNKDLKALKYIVKKYLKGSYYELFRGAKNNSYTAYVESSENSEAFFKNISKLTEKLDVEESDRPLYEKMRSDMEAGIFLRKQKDGDNRVIPYQLYLYELQQLLKKAEGYLDFLSEKDENGLTVSDKIVSVFAFRVPYFVGPLNRHSQKAWFVRKTEGKIYPWNFTEKVDLDLSEEEFIKRMTNTCTYLPGETVIPKESLVYHKFTVLNEINNIKIDGVPLPVKVKQRLYNEYFMGNRRVSAKGIKGFLKSINCFGDGQELSGIDIQINSNLKPHHDFKRLVESGMLSETDVERIIERLTYSEDRRRTSKWLKDNFSSLSEEDVRYISKLNYKDFGRLSKKFLCGFVGTEKSTGETATIIDFLWNTNNNLMMLLSERFTFTEELEKLREEYYSNGDKSIDEQLNDMYISNAVKRPIIRTMEIVKEIKKACGRAPDRIFIEMARGGTADQKNKRTLSRRRQLEELYKKCRDEDVRLVKAQLEEMGDLADNNLQSDRLYLYFMQLGRCMYSGEAIDISAVRGTTYNIDHIYPQAFVKDDSVLNNKVLVRSEDNGQKSDTYPVSPAVQSKMRGFWKMLKDNGLITEEKYKRLIRTDAFSDEERLAFINRQLTETTQSTKAVATLLKKYYPETEIVYVKARLTSEFRQEFDMLKSRTYNDLHHAKDAYLNIVTGNVYHHRFSKNWFRLTDHYSMRTSRVFGSELVRGGEVIWNKDEMLGTIRKIVAKNNAHMTRYAYCKHSGQSGGLFDQKPVKAAEGLVPRKKGLSTEKYGGYNGSTITFFVMIKYTIGKKTDVMIMPVELLFADKACASEEAMAEYAKNRIGRITGKTVDFVSFPLGMRKIKINTMLSLDGYRVCITGSSSGGRCIIPMPFVPFVADSKTELYIKRLEAFVEKCKENPNFVYRADYDKVTEEENIRLYDLYIEKLTNSIFVKRPNNPAKTLVDGRNIFAKLDIKEQSKALLSIHQVFGRVADGCDLTAVGGAKASATTKISSNISNWKKRYKDVRIIDASVSGLWEKKSQNLLELL